MFTWWKNFHDSFSDGITFFDDVGIFIAFGTFAFTAINWWNNRKQNVDVIIELVLADTSQKKALIQTIKRRHLTRSEVLGVLGTVYQGNKRYDIPFLAKREFSKRLEKAQEGKTEILQIEIDNKNTFDQFICD